MNKINLKVTGMMCTGCEKRICNILEENLDIEKVKASHKKELVEITSEEELDKEEITKLIESLGFKVEK